MKQLKSPWIFNVFVYL